MNVVSLFSGVGGFDLGFEQAGFRTVYQCEWDKHATRILERHWPDVPKWGDVQTLTGDEILRHCSTPDVIIWGSPCQDLSVAGKRAGLDGERSGLFHEGIRIINELREATDGRYPRISVWENVAGALNSNRGADFGTVLNEMAEAGAVVIEWALLDAQYFGVPQRRRRVFVVAVFDPATASRCPDPLLPVSESVRGDSAKSRKKGQATTGQVAGSPRDGSCEPFVKSGRAQTINDDETWIPGDINPTLNQFDTGDTRTTTAIVEPIYFQLHQSGDTRIQEQVMHTLAGYMGTGGNNTPMVAQPIGFSHTQGLSAQPSEQAFPTLRTEGNGMAIAFQPGTMVRLGGGVWDEMSPTLRAEAKRGDNEPHIATGMAVRRLTPLECERLMGWPDNWTDGQADSHRYRQCGNGVATPVARWIANHIKPTMEDN